MPTNSHGMNERRYDDAQRDAECARLRAQGLTYEQIAQQVGYADKSNARKAVQRALVATVQEAGDELRALELERYNRLEQECWKIIDKPHYAHSAGRLITLDDVPLIDDAPTLQAIDRLLKVMDQRAKLMGINAPQRHEVLTTDAIDAEIQRLDREFAELAAGSPTGQAPGVEGSPGT